MSHRPTNELQSDLIIGFGFSKPNAQTALTLFDYFRDALSYEEAEALKFIDEKDPFTAAMGQPTTPQIPHKMIETLEHLNYRITTGVIK